MNSQIRKYRRFIIPALIGGLAGFLYYRLVGCSSGGCMISSNPWISASYGILLGVLFADAIKPKTSINTEKQS